jgi:hypothetical protein
MSESQQRTKTFEEKQQPAHAFDRRCLLACFAISIFLVVWITLASRSFNSRFAVFLFLLPWVLLRAGGLITAALRLPSFFALDFLLGVAVVSIAVMVWKVLIPFSLWFLLIVILVAVASLPKLLPHNQRDAVSAFDLLCVIASLVAATAWSQDLIVPMRHVEGGIVFKPWSDFFFHAAIIAQSLGGQTLTQVGNYEWHGFPAIFYHYASYSLAACLATVGHLPAYDTAVGFWSPFGSFLTGLASYALGRVFWSQGAGLAALVGASLIPDAALLNIGHPIYSYFWLQHVAPGGLYGVAIAGTAMILIAEGAREGRRLWLGSGLILAAVVALFKVQVFAAAFPLLLCFSIVFWPSRKPLRWFVLSVCVAAGLALLPFANRFYIGLDVHFNFAGIAWYWKTLAHMANGTPVATWYRVFGDAQTFPSHLPQAVGLMLLNGLGVFAIVAPAIWLVTLRRKTWQASDGISAAAIAIFLLMTFGLSGDLRSSELIHRPFVWTYWLVSSLTAGRLFSMFAGTRPQLWTRAVVVSVIALTLLPVYYGSGLQRGKSLGGNVHSHLRVDRGLIDCARYIRSQPPTDAVAQDSHLDNFVILGALSERPAFAARPDIWKAVSKAFRDSTYQDQLLKLETLQQATNVADLQRSVRETGIRWYVVHPDDSKVWPIEFRDHPVFESGGYRVYDMKRCFDLRG